MSGLPFSLPWGWPELSGYQKRAEERCSLRLLHLLSGLHSFPYPDAFQVAGGWEERVQLPWPCPCPCLPHFSDISFSGQRKQSGPVWPTELTSSA